LEHLLADDEVRNRVEARDYYLRMENDLRASGFDEGEKRANERAYADKLAKAREALDNNIPLNVIRMLTGLDAKTLEGIQREFE